MPNVCAFEVPPAGVALNTVTVAVPVAAMSVAGIAAVSWAEETKVVARGDPFHCTTEPPTKLVPFTVRVKAAPPAVAAAGGMLDTGGTGLGVALTLAACAFALPPR